MSLQTCTPKESLKITGTSCKPFEVSNYVTTSTDSNITTITQVTSQSPRKGLTSLKSFMEELELSEEENKLLSEERKWVSETYYKDEVSLKAVRLDRGLSQAGLAELIGTSQPQIAKLESKAQDPQLSTIRKLAEALSMSVGDMAGILSHD